MSMFISAEHADIRQAIMVSVLERDDYFPIRFDLPIERAANFSYVCQSNTAELFSISTNQVLDRMSAYRKQSFYAAKARAIKLMHKVDDCLQSGEFKYTFDRECRVVAEHHKQWRVTTRMMHSGESCQAKTLMMEGLVMMSILSYEDYEAHPDEESPMGYKRSEAERAADREQSAKGENYQAKIGVKDPPPPDGGAGGQHREAPPVSETEADSVTSSSARKDAAEGTSIEMVQMVGRVMTGRALEHNVRERRPPQRRPPQPYRYCAAGAASAPPPPPDGEEEKFFFHTEVGRTAVLTESRSPQEPPLPAEVSPQDVSPPVSPCRTESSSAPLAEQTEPPLRLPEPEPPPQSPPILGEVRRTNPRQRPLPPFQQRSPAGVPLFSDYGLLLDGSAQEGQHCLGAPVQESTGATGTTHVVAVETTATTTHDDALHHDHTQMALDEAMALAMVSDEGGEEEGGPRKGPPPEELEEEAGDLGVDIVAMDEEDDQLADLLDKVHSEREVLARENKRLQTELEEAKLKADKLELSESRGREGGSGAEEDGVGGGVKGEDATKGFPVQKKFGAASGMLTTSASVGYPGKQG